MRIDAARPRPSEQPNTATAKPQGGAFAGVMKQSRTELRRDALTPLLANVEQRGKRLAEHRTLENLVAYKQSIKQFLGESLRHGIQLSDQAGSSFGEGAPPQQIVKVIDEKVIALQDQLLDNEVEYIGILETVGEIKGLLLNLYM
ncbi:YaaR family protein [Planococcus alpniumensis]|uniref:YaaR family protein n=1 Tax=Planococcus alpniumensis TaxID=2708345 RepID=UPI001B8C0BEF|nr:YaaR family protein [Planococcus sp. MSAK28401]